MKSKILAENLANGSGGHGIKQEVLEQIFSQHEDKLDDLCYTFKKVFSTSGPEFFSTQKIDIQNPWDLEFTKWHFTDESGMLIGALIKKMQVVMYTVCLNKVHLKDLQIF